MGLGSWDLCRHISHVITRKKKMLSTGGPYDKTTSSPRFFNLARSLSSADEPDELLALLMAAKARSHDAATKSSHKDFDDVSNTKLS